MVLNLFSYINDEIFLIVQEVEGEGIKMKMLVFVKTGEFFKKVE